MAVDGKRVKNLGDKEPDVGLKCVLYLKAAMLFTAHKRSKRVKRIGQTLNLLQRTMNLLKSKQMKIKDVRLEVLCLRAQALLLVELHRQQTLKDTAKELNISYNEEDDQPPEAKRARVDTEIKTEPGQETEEEECVERTGPGDAATSEISSLPKPCLSSYSHLATSEQSVTVKAEVPGDGNSQGIKEEPDQANSSRLPSESQRLWHLASSLLVGAGGQEAGTGGQEAGTGGQEAGTGGQDAGTGGQGAGTGGQEAGLFFQQLELEVGALGLEAGLGALLTYTNRALGIISRE